MLKRRTLLGMSQERLGEALGLTFQQVQKYERGVNRVGASRLYDLSRVLDVPISFFFDDMPMGGGSVSFAQRNHGVAEPGLLPSRSPRKSSDGLATSLSPPLTISKTPISSLGPNRFLTARRMR